MPASNSAEPSRLPDEAHELFAAEPDRFVELRDLLAKELKKKGAADEASTVRKLRKPTLAVWAINQAVRSQPDVARDLLDAGRAMASAGSGAELRRASAGRQAAIRTLVDEAIGHLEESGYGASASVGDKITQTLLALTADDDAANAFAKGVLERELEPDLDFGFAFPTAPAEPDAESTNLSEARSRVDDLSGRVRDMEKEVAELERRAREADDRLQLAEMEVERVSKQLDSARARLEKIRTQAAEAASTLDALEEGRRRKR